jgi:hypothetical protein
MSKAPSTICKPEKYESMAGCVCDTVMQKNETDENCAFHIEKGRNVLRKKYRKTVETPKNKRTAIAFFV